MPSKRLGLICYDHNTRHDAIFPLANMDHDQWLKMSCEFLCMPLFGFHASYICMYNACYVSVPDKKPIGPELQARNLPPRWPCRTSCVLISRLCWMIVVAQKVGPFFTWVRKFTSAGGMIVNWYGVLRTDSRQLIRACKRAARCRGVQLSLRLLWQTESLFVAARCSWYTIQQEGGGFSSREQRSRGDGMGVTGAPRQKGGETCGRIMAARSLIRPHSRSLRDSWPYL